MNDAKLKAIRLHAAFTVLLDHYKDLVKDTNSEPAFGKNVEIEIAEKELFANRPLADWEQLTVWEQPTVIDNDKGEITVSLEGKELRGWSYSSDAERRQKMLQAREYIEGWCDGREAA